jgi:hypothetical protein
MRENGSRYGDPDAARDPAALTIHMSGDGEAYYCTR